MAELLNRSVQTLQETLRSKSPHRGSQAANIAEDLYTFTIERITDTELGKLQRTHTPIKAAHVGAVLSTPFHSVLLVSAIQH